MARKIGIILLVFVGFYMGAHYYIRWRNTVHDDVSKVSRLVECDPNEVREVIVGQKGQDEEGGTLRFQRLDEPRNGIPSSTQLAFSEWKFVAPLSGEADTAALVRLSSMFCELYDPIPARDEDFTPGEAKVEGVSFDIPEGKAKGVYRLEFGRITEDRLNVVKFFSPAGESRTLKIPPKILQLVSQEPGSFLNLKVMRMSADNVTVATVFSGTREKFTLEREGDGWRVLVAGKLKGKGSEDAARYINRLATLKALKVDTEALSPTACEGGAARMRVRLLGVAGREETLFFQYGKKGPVTACNTARAALFTVHRDLIPYLEQPLERMIAN